MKQRNSLGAARYRSLGILILGLTGAQAAWGSGSPCVANDSQLALALADAQASATTIRLVQGNYHLDQTVWNAQGPQTAKFHAGSSLLGGYTATCASRDIAVGNTTLFDATTTFPGVNAQGDATFEGITFNLKNGFSLTTHGIAAGSEVLFRRNVFTGSSTNDSAGLLLEWNNDTGSGGTVRLVDNLVRGNSNGSGHQELGAVTLFVDGGSPKIELVNNTVVDNNGSLEGVSVQSLSPVAVYGYNNIFFGNAGLDFVVQTGNKTVLVDNDIGTYFFPPPATAVVGMTRGDPKLDANFKPIESPPSPVINTGTDDVIGGLPATDLPGRAREIGSEPDRGAFESIINDSVLQSVTNTNDAGAGSLRAAILSANASGSSGAIISFDIGTTCGPNVITLQTALPDVTAETHIYGFTQPGASSNTLNIGDDAEICVILDGSAHSISDGFTVPANIADSIKLAVNGIAFSGFTHAAVNLRGGSGHNISGVHIGGSVNGVTLDPVNYGIIVGPGVHDSIIGGDFTNPGLRNIIGQALSNGINIDASGATLGPAHDIQVINNYIGIGYSGTTLFNRGNGVSGVSVGGYNNEVQHNYINFNVAQGVHLTGTDAHDNLVADNQIGYQPGRPDAGNGIGVLIDSGSHDNDTSFNAIFSNVGAGVQVVGQSERNYMYGNNMDSNGGLGIDLGGDGVTANDNDSLGATLPNRGQNYPVITAAGGGHTSGVVSATLTSTPGVYTVEAFVAVNCDASGHGEGTFSAGDMQVTVPNITSQGQSSVSFDLPIKEAFVSGFTNISLTAIDSANNTSEFSACFPYTDDTIFADDFEVKL